MAQGVTPAGSPVGNRVEGFGDRNLHRKVVDQILSSTTYANRVMGRAQRMTGKYMDFTLKISDAAQGEWITGLEVLNSAAEDDTIETSYSQNTLAQPVVSIMLESMANAGSGQVIDIDQYKIDNAVASAVQKLATAVFSTGSGDQIKGLGAIVDDGTDVTSVGGQSRSTYSVLNATRTASGGTLTLAKMATLDDTISASGMADESPNIGVTTKTVWSLFEQLLQPQVRNDYSLTGGNVLPLRGDGILSRKDAGATGGFTALTFRGFPIIKDDFATSGNLFFLNERYFGYFGRDIVPTKYKGQIARVRLSEGSTIEGVGAAVPPSDYGWFFQDYQMMPNQAGMIARYFIIGQMICWQFRRQGRLTGITGI